MKRFEFSLGRVLDFKNQMLDREKDMLARLRLERTKLEQLLHQREKEFQRLNDEMTEKSLRGITVVMIMGYQLQLDGLRAEIAEIEMQLEQYDLEIERQLEQVITMSRDVSGLDKLKEHQKEAFVREVAKAEELEIAEFVSGKLIRQKEA